MPIIPPKTAVESGHWFTGILKNLEDHDAKNRNVDEREQKLHDQPPATPRSAGIVLKLGNPALQIFQLHWR